MGHCGKPLFFIHQSDYFSPGAIHDQFKGAIEKEMFFLGSSSLCLVDFGDFHAANRKNKNTKCLPLGWQAENKRLGSTALHFWEHSLRVL